MTQYYPHNFGWLRRTDLERKEDSRLIYEQPDGKLVAFMPFRKDSTLVIKLTPDKQKIYLGGTILEHKVVVRRLPYDPANPQKSK